MGNWVNAQAPMEKQAPDNNIGLKKLYQVGPERKLEPPETINLFLMVIDRINRLGFELR